ncbi:MAG TPA: ABC transporter ATP-binding protein [Longimicrobium sp.]|nr:ABC transporter ATP-binding protein [Longimicrobium sp.]
MILLDGVVKDFGGPLARARGDRVRALDGVSLHAAPGTALGLIGPNGAGKSTLIRLLLGYLNPTRGMVRIDGMEPRRFAERHGIGYVPDRVALPGYWTVWRALEVFAALGEVDHADDRIEAVIERLGLEPVARRRVAALSKGNLQRLALAQALLGERRVMVLDEATDGLDVEWAARVLALVDEWRKADPGRVLVFASHDLEEVEQVADRVVVLQDGRVREEIDLRAGRGEGPTLREQYRRVRHAIGAGGEL